MRTKERLAQALHALGLFELERKARAGSYDDYESESGTPKVDLVRDVGAADLSAHFTSDHREAFIDRVRHGDFDNTKEEAEAWAASEEGQRLYRELFEDKPRRS